MKYKNFKNIEIKYSTKQCKIATIINILLQLREIDESVNMIDRKINVRYKKDSNQTARDRKHNI